MTEAKCKWSDLLPIQSDYWMLHNGKQFGKQGGKDCNGYLVFASRNECVDYKERLEKYGSIEFDPIKVKVGTMLNAIADSGLCVVNGTTIRVIEAKHIQEMFQKMEVESIVANIENGKYLH